MKGLSGQVEILRDKWAVPHIFAQSETDLFKAQGYAHAQERLWQMELFKRVSAGRLSELFGKETLDADRILRTLGFRRLGLIDAQSLKTHPENIHLLELLQAYADGVNAFIETQTALPAEFQLLRTRPEKWTPTDSLSIARFLAFQMSYGWLHQLERAKILAAVGEEKAKELFVDYPQINPEVLPFGNERNFWEDGRLKALDSLYLRPVGGSNNWAIASHKMRSGSALLANDPHLLLNNPNIWIENHLCAPTYECTGVSVAGIPFVLIGHNRQIAWGATLSFVDTQDLFVERFLSDECKQYEFGDEIRKSTLLEEKIIVKGQKNPYAETVVHTHHGVIISEVLGDKKQKLALASPVLKENEMVLGFYRLNQSKNWDDFVDAVAKISAPSLNLAYADTEDNIGYYCSGRVPIRQKDKFGLPVLGYTGTYEWIGSVPSEEIPHTLNPKRGYVFSCNNKISAPNYPHDLGGLYMNGYRAARLQELFDQTPQVDISDCKAWQLDIFCQSSKVWLEWLRTQSPKLSPETQTIWTQILAWDGFLTTETVGGCMYQILLKMMSRALFEKDLGQAYAGFTGKSEPSGLFAFNEFWAHERDAVLSVLKNPNSAWKNPKTWDTAAFIGDCLQQTQAYLKQRLGNNPNIWTWGRIHKLTFKHSLGVRPPLDALMNISEIPIGGDMDTLAQASELFESGAVCGASYRQIIDMGNFNNSLSISPLGQSGNKLSPHLQDQLPLWLKGEYKPMFWAKTDILENVKYKMRLIGE